MKIVDCHRCMICCCTWQHAQAKSTFSLLHLSFLFSFFSKLSFCVSNKLPKKRKEKEKKWSSNHALKRHFWCQSNPTLFLTIDNKNQLNIFHTKNLMGMHASFLEIIIIFKIGDKFDYKIMDSFRKFRCINYENLYICKCNTTICTFILNLNKNKNNLKYS